MIRVGITYAIGAWPAAFLAVGERLHGHRHRAGDSGHIPGNSAGLPGDDAIVAFIPLLFIPGTMGKFWWPLPALVITGLEKRRLNTPPPPQLTSIYS